MGQVSLSAGPMWSMFPPYCPQETKTWEEPSSAWLSQEGLCCTQTKQAYSWSQLLSATPWGLPGQGEKRGQGEPHPNERRLGEQNPQGGWEWWRGREGGGPRAIRTAWDLEIESKQRLKWSVSSPLTLFPVEYSFPLPHPLPTRLDVHKCLLSSSSAHSKQ